MDSSFSQHQTRSRHQRPLILGDPERDAEAIRSKEGIPLLKPVVEDCWILRKRQGSRLRLGGHHDVLAIV
jgi:hypothetical protein